MNTIIHVYEVLAASGIISFHQSLSDHAVVCLWSFYAIGFRWAVVIMLRQRGWIKS